MTRNPSPLGLYLHIPFCRGKCPYCDFYSLRPDGDGPEQLARRLHQLIEEYGKRSEGYTVRTVYFGGGTPLLLGAQRLAALLDRIRASFPCEITECTVECNPGSTSMEDLQVLHKAGVNRLSIGMQAADDGVLRALGRKHRMQDTVRLVQQARQAGFHNLSLDLMLGVPEETDETLDSSLSAIRQLQPEHVSAYLLKLEPDTPFYEQRFCLGLPDEDQLAARYARVVQALEGFGLSQYEVSNFARPGFHSRHNTAYWRLTPYLGLGPSAHSFFGGRRFYFLSDLNGFLHGADPVDDGPGGDYEELLMLGLRLTRGVSVQALRDKDPAAAEYTLQKAAPLIRQGVLAQEDGRLKICSQFLLLMNTIICDLLP